jgi:DNA transposition AAA+ family ATPase
LHDKTGIGILLAGMHKLLGNLRGIRGQYSQLYSRVGMAVKLEPLKESDTENIVYKQLHLKGDLWKVFHSECSGNTRRLFKMINRSIHIAEVNNIIIDEDVVLKASELCKIEKMY